MRRQIEAADESAERSSWLPAQVQRLLEEHLEDPSLAVAVVYGEWFPALYSIDPVWATGVLNSIFPRDDAASKRACVAFDAYLVRWVPGSEMLPLLCHHYEKAIERLGSLKRDEHIDQDPEEDLVHHLVVLYWLGATGLDDAGGLLARFWARASDALAAYALEYVGRSLTAHEGEVEPEVIERLTRLWEHRSNEILHDPDAHKRELWSFGWWFYSGHFDDLWAVKQVERVVDAVGIGDLHHLVEERLAAISSEHPGEALRCLALLVRKNEEGWLIWAMQKEARVILENALGSKNADTIREAKALIDDLARQGYRGFEDLWLA